MTQTWNLPCAALLFSIAALVAVSATHAQERLPRIALKGGESVDLRNFFFITNCQSVLTAPTVVEVLEGPDEVSLKIRDEMILPRAQNCPRPVPGGIVVATASEVAQPKEAKLTFRLKFSTKMGPRQNSNTYIVSLYPSASPTGPSVSTTPSLNSTNSAGPGSPQ